MPLSPPTRRSSRRWSSPTASPISPPLIAVIIVGMLGITLAGALIPSSIHASGKSPEVVVSIRPVHALVAGVMAGVGTPDLLMQGVGSPHDHALRPSEARLLSKARLLVWVGPELETFLDRAQALLPDGARSLALMEVHGLQHRPNRPPGVWVIEAPGEPGRTEADQDKAGKDHKEAGSAEHDDDHGRNNPHLWLDPVNARILVGAIAEALSNLDPERSKIYLRNALRMASRIAHLELEMTPRLKRMRDRPFVVAHDAFAHLEQRFNLWGLGALSQGGGQGSGARRMVSLRQALIRAREQAGVACIFTEPQTPPRIVAPAAEGTGVRQAVLDPLGLSHPPGEELYFALMQDLTTQLSECLNP